MTLEDRILFTCTRQDFTPAHQDLVLALASSAEVCWEEVLRMAERHGVAPLVDVNLRRCGAGLSVSPQVSARFEDARLANLVYKELMAKRVAAALAWFNARSIDVMLLKGTALDLLIYDQPWFTRPADIDLVLRCRRNTAAFEQMRGTTVALLRLKIEVNFFEHHDITMNGALPVDFERIWRDAREVEVRGQRAFVMSAEDLLLSMCINACRKRFFRLKSLLDLAECILRLRDLDWEAFSQRAREFQCHNIVLTALLAADAALGCGLPAGVLDGLDVHPARIRFVRALVRHLLQRFSLASLSPFSGALWHGKRIGLSLLLPYASYSWSQAWRSLDRSLDRNPKPEKAAVRIPSSAARSRTAPVKLTPPGPQ